ncbi:MAG: hypothetical protein DWI58_10900 [Chloroflexi bacterium]|nr:MAG: hypothetical protein DWI58_10900 [Chloroflexota bacterium]
MSPAMRSGGRSGFRGEQCLAVARDGRAGRLALLFQRALRLGERLLQGSVQVALGRGQRL